jgi:hypothetical protein
MEVEREHKKFPEFGAQLIKEYAANCKSHGNKLFPFNFSSHQASTEKFRLCLD